MVEKSGEEAGDAGGSAAAVSAAAVSAVEVGGSTAAGVDVGVGVDNSEDVVGSAAGSGVDVEVTGAIPVSAGAVEEVCATASGEEIVGVLDITTLLVVPGDSNCPAGSAAAVVAATVVESAFAGGVSLGEAATGEADAPVATRELCAAGLSRGVTTAAGGVED
ncbi:hypothetical protein YB2330_001854 [Saitoella coloradoensis]